MLFISGRMKTPQTRSSLSRITAYLEVKIWSLFKNENLTTGNKILWKKGAISPLFHNIFNISLRQGVKLRIICEMWLFDLFILNSANLVCRYTDISKYFRLSFEIRDKESQLYLTQAKYLFSYLFSYLLLLYQFVFCLLEPSNYQKVAGSTPAEVGNILSWRLIMKYFLRSFSPFR